MSVPLFNISQQTASLKEAFKLKFDEIVDSSQFINGPEVVGLENEMAIYLGSGVEVTGVSSGTDALIVALMAEGIGKGDKVLVPAFTFFATAGSVARVGATPVFVDIEPESFNMCVEDLKEKYTPECKAIIPVHLYGQAADMDAIIAFAKEKDLIVIEDAAQASGATYKDSQVGTIGDWGCFSFFPTKNIGALGDAGAVCTKNPEKSAKAKQTRNHGDVSRYEHAFVGGNFRIDAMQAAFMRIKLPHLDSYIQKRRANAAFYKEQLGGVEGIMLPAEMPNAKHTYNQFTLRVKDGQRDALREHLNSLGIGSQVYYPITLNDQACFAPNSDNCPNAQQATAEALSIPIFPELTVQQLTEVVDGIKSFVPAAV